MATYLDLARRIVGDEDDEFLGFLLWNHTPFPLTGVLDVARHLKHWRRLSDQGLSECIWCGEGYQSEDGKVHVGGSCGKPHKGLDF